MGPEMIKEIVPLSEALRAFVVVTVENLNLSLCARVYEIKDSVFSSMRRVLLDLHRI